MKIYGKVSKKKRKGGKVRSRDLCWPITGQYSGHLIKLGQSEASIQVTWSDSTNQRPVLNIVKIFKDVMVKIWKSVSLRSRGLGFDPCTWTWIESWQMQKSVNITNELSQQTIQKTQNLWVRSSVAFIETSMKVMWPVLTNQRPVSRSRDLCWPIRGQY